MLFEKNKNENTQQYWFFKKVFRSGESDAGKFSKLPSMAFYWEDPSKLVYDTRKELIVNTEHIITDNKSRFPAPYNFKEDYELKLRRSKKQYIPLQTEKRSRVNSSKESIKRISGACFSKGQGAPKGRFQTGLPSPLPPIVVSQAHTLRRPL